MTASTGKPGIGASLLIGDGATPTENFTAIANVKSIQWNGRDVAELDLTHLQSDNGYKEFKPGFKDPGSVTLTVHFDPTHPTHVGSGGVSGYFEARTVFNFKLDFSSIFGKVCTSKGYIKNPGDITVNPDNPVEASITIRCSGPVTWA